MADIALFKNYKPYQKLLVLLLVFLGFSIIFPIFLMLLGMIFWGREVVMAGGSNNTPMSYLIFFQLFTQLLAFGGSALFFAAIVNNKPLKFIGIKPVYNYKLLLIPAVAMFLVIPLSSWLQQMSLSVSVPESWQPFMDSLKMQEESRNNLMMRFLNVNGIGWLLFNLFFMAVVPAICEELLFRGALIGVLKEMVNNKHVVVVLSAIIFSAIHMQFFSFMSRFALGLVLGYAYVYSGSIIPSIVAHFVNNAISVIGYYFSDRSDISEVGSFNNPWMVVLSTFAAVLTIVWMQKYHKKYVEAEV